MITRAMFGKIRRMYFRDGLSLSEIARRTSLSRNTVKQWVRTPTGEERRYRRPGKAKRLSGYDAPLIRALEADAQRPKRQRRTALLLHAELQQAGFSGSYRRVTELVRRWREAPGPGMAKTALGNFRK